jgi:hypothetical protein
MMSTHKPSPGQPTPRHYCSEECKAKDEARLADAEKAFNQRRACGHAHNIEAKEKGYDVLPPEDEAADLDEAKG